MQVGCLRTFLAITVLVGHSYGFLFTGPILAVQVFYLISGFLISFVLTEARQYGRISNFYLNRFLRLFPVYWVVALGTLVSLLAAEIFLGIDTPTFDVFRQIDLAGKISLIFSNLFIFGQDWIMFTAVQDGTFQFSANYRNSEIPVWHGLLVPPAWTLGVELSFYLIAPFVLFRLRWIIGLLLTALALRGLLIAYGPGLQDPWNYRFFPTELALFFVGAISHQFWMPWLRRSGLLSKNSAVWIALIVMAGCLCFAYLPLQRVSWVIFLVFVAAALPFLFQFQRHFKWDRQIGELSYPIYIAHWSILYPVSYLWDRALGLEGYTGFDETLVVLALTVIAAILLNRYVTERVEIVRRAVKEQQEGKVMEKTFLEGAPFYGVFVNRK